MKNWLKLVLLLALLASARSVFAVAGCGAGTDNTLCGNVGDPYEGGEPPGGTELTACGALTRGTNYYLSGNLGSDPAAICLTIGYGAAATILDLGGYTLTGQISGTGINANALTIFNGTVNCNISPTPSACIKITSAAAYTAPTRLHHLTVHNAADPGTATVASIYLEWSGLDGTNPAIEVDHIAGYVGTAATSNRATFLRLVTGKKSDTHDNDLTCNADTKACQLIEAIGPEGYVNGIIHNNKLTMTTNSVSGGLPRAITVTGPDDGAVGAQGWQVYNNYCAANNGRCFRFRQVSDVLVHDNEVVNCAATDSYGCYHFGDPSGSTAAVTVQKTPETVTKTAHGFTDGQKTRFTTTSAGIVAQTDYFVCSATADTWQLDSVSAACSNILNITANTTNTVYWNHAFVSDAMATIYGGSIAMDTGCLGFWLRDGNGWSVKNVTITGTHGKLGQLDTPGQPPPGGPVSTSATFCGITGASSLDVDSTAATSTTVHHFSAGTWTGAGTIDPLGSCEGIGSPGAVLTPLDHPFLLQGLGTASDSSSVTLSNTGDSTLNISSIVATGDFGQENDCGTTLGAGLTCSIDVTFTPTQKGTRTGAIIVTDDAASSPQATDVDGPAYAEMLAGGATVQGGTVQ